MSTPIVPAWVWALAIMVPCPECGADGGELCRVDCTGEASMVASIEDWSRERCAGCDNPIGRKSPCEDCNVVHCEACWEERGCVECGGAS